MQVSGEECFGSRIGSYQGSLKDKLTTPGWVNLCIRLCTEKVSCSLQTVTLFREEASKEAEDPMHSLVRWLQMFFLFFFRVLGIKWSEFKTESNGLNTAKKMFLIVILSKDLSHPNIFFILARPDSLLISQICLYSPSWILVLHLQTHSSRDYSYLILFCPCVWIKSWISRSKNWKGAKTCSLLA